MTPYKRGFYCDDESIRYPYMPSTVSRQMLIVIGIMIPTLLKMGAELLRLLVWERQCPILACPSTHCALWRKYTIERHRPHFMDECKPATKLPTRGPSDDVTRMVVKEFHTNCPPKNTRMQQTFSRIHAILLFVPCRILIYAAWYTALYLQARLYRPLISKLVLPASQFSVFGGAAFVAYSRVSNYKHHSDVLVGALVGTAIGLIVGAEPSELLIYRHPSVRRILHNSTLP
uniref:AcidPPc domain-containing protein n=1 Tax=Globodera pallida TaxID=36090 RepID=A0A183BX18_GLOPA